jgi:hypothetical protein
MRIDMVTRDAPLTVVRGVWRCSWCIRFLWWSGQPVEGCDVVGCGTDAIGFANGAKRTVAGGVASEPRHGKGSHVPADAPPATGSVAFERTRNEQEAR